MLKPIDLLSGPPGDDTVKRREFWAYVRTFDGVPLPSTIREKAGDCDAALEKTDNRYRGTRVRKTRVIVEWKSPIT